MFSKSSVLAASLAVLGVTAVPAGPGNPAYVNTNNRKVYHGSNDTMGIYGMIEEFNSNNWFDKFNVEAISDPTHGYVNYLNYQDARNSGLYQVRGNQVYIGVDHQSQLDPGGRGRNSVRLSSKAAFNRALVIADFAHIPGSVCGSWPAFWMFGPNWPNSGEIDIIEGVHQQNFNQMTLHSSPGCVPVPGNGGQYGTPVGERDCGAGGGYNGCGVRHPDPNSYGNGFNSQGGGVYAMEWTSNGIKVWNWYARDIPQDIRNNNPNPGRWGQPAANFAGCDWNRQFRDMNIIFDITFCGDWAGSVWGQSGCQGRNPSCNGFVASQPGAFADSYWLVNSVKVYST